MRIHPFFDLDPKSSQKKKRKNQNKISLSVLENYFEFS